MLRAMTLTRARLVSLTVIFAAGPLLANRAQAGNEEEARGYLDKATAAYALNKYSVAAENFEKAFELKPDPALLYNAAQAWRLAGNKERALALYESYLRVYPANDKRSTVEARIKDLRQAIEREKAVVNQPPNNTLPIGSAGTNSPPAYAPNATTPPASPPQTMPPPKETQPVQPVQVAQATPPPSAPPPTEASSSNPTMLTQNASPPAENTPLTKKPLFWVGVGGGVVAVTVIILVLALGGGENPASASLGRASGN
jgi:tetratricopeptide (TPR) repeat protein